MRPLSVAIVALGIAFVAGLSVAGGLDVTGAIILAFVVAMGALAVAVIRRAGTRAVRPAECPSCGGIVSPSAPYCKHCGAALSR